MQILHIFISSNFRLKPLHWLKWFIIVSVYLIATIGLNAQESNLLESIDSLEKRFNRTNYLEDKIKLYLYKSRLSSVEDPSSCQIMLDSIESDLKDLPNESLYVDYYLRRGECDQNDNNLLAALNFYLKAEDIAKQDHPSLWDVYYDIGILYDILEVYEKTKEYGLKGQKYAQKKEMPSKEISSIYTVISAAYQLRDFELLKKQCERAIELEEKHSLKFGMSYVFYLLGKTALHENQVASAINYFKQGEILAQEDNDADGVSQAQEGLSLAYLEKKDLQKARFYADQALSFTPNYQSDRNLDLSKVYAAAGEHKKAFSMLRENVEIKEEQKRENNPSSILSKVLSDKFDQEKQQEADKFNAQFEFQQKLNHRNMWLGILATVIAFFLFLFYYRKRQNKIRNRMLRQQVAEQTQEIRAQKERLEDLDDFKSKLYTNITHEFRTPLTVILGMSEQIEKDLPNISRDKVKEKLSFISRNGNSLLQLINQMLDLSKLENNQLGTNLIQNDVIGYLRYISESFHSVANGQNVVLKLEVDQSKIVMDYDPEKFRQIVTNLLSNAIKYSSSGDKISITVNAVNRHLEFSVEDSGMGISEENLPHIFDRFFQAEDTVSRARGTGIGLALTQELVELLGGTITAVSKLNQGSIFTVRLPITNNAEKKATTFGDGKDMKESHMAIVEPSLNTELSLETVSKIARLLVVEDNLDVSEYIASCLESQYALDFAYNGAAGIERALELTPDIIISDVMMPEKDGFELCETLKNDERTSHIPIVLLTAKADIDSRIAGLKRGADAYLKKPFHQEELDAVLENLLETRKKLQSKYSQIATQFSNSETIEKTQDLEDVFLLKLREILEEELGNSSLKAEDVCKKIGMGRTNLYGKLQAVTGMSFNIYLRKLRLNKAKELLLNSSLNVSEIAYEVGFNDPLYFSRTFSEEFGIPPSKYKS